jgi:hypothetical protein
VILANNRSTKLGTLICSAHARTVRSTGADRPDRGPSGLRAGQSDGSFLIRTMVLPLDNFSWSVSSYPTKIGAAMVCHTLVWLLLTTLEHATR